MLAIAVGMVALVALMDAPPGYDRLPDGIPGYARGEPMGEFRYPVVVRLDRRQVAMLGEVLGPPTVLEGTGDYPTRRGYVFGRSDRPLIGFAIWLRADGTATTGGWQAEPRIPPWPELRQQWLAPGIVSWLDAVTALE